MLKFLRIIIILCIMFPELAMSQGMSIELLKPGEANGLIGYTSGLDNRQRYFRLDSLVNLFGNNPDSLGGEAASFYDHSLAGYLTSYTETDPTVPNHVKSITTTNISNWNMAHSWGDHSLAGYLTSYTETDPTIPNHVKSITTTNISNWNVAYSWGDHSLAGYLTSYTETDPTIPNHVKSITTTNISNWNTAFAWGNHASAGYLTSYTETDPTVPSHVKAITTTNVSNWNTAYGWGDHASAGYLTSYTETDPTVPSHVKSITTTNISNWNTAYGWGDHASAGYLTSYTETDPTVPSHVKSITTTNISNWNTAYGWGNHASAGYLTSYTETDPTVPSHVKSITTTNISNWNTAYGWGNHASAGYLTSYTETDGDILNEIQIYSISDYIVAGDTIGVVIEMSENGGEHYLIEGNNITIRRNGTQAIISGLGPNDIQTFRDYISGSNLTGLTLTLNGIGQAGASVTFTGWDNNASDDWTTADFSPTNISSWNAAFGWGDHSSAGYLTSYTETDPNVPNHVKSITTTNISNWNTAFGWGNHASAGYLTSYTETDPNVPSHVKSITTTNISNWNTAYGWGDHASAGYLTEQDNLGNHEATENLKMGSYQIVGVGGFTQTSGPFTVNASGNISVSTSGLLNLTTFGTGDMEIASLTGEIKLIPKGVVPNEGQLWITNSNGGLTFIDAPDFSSINNPDSLGGISANNYWSTADFSTTNISNWNTAFGWGNHASAGYLTSYTETDPNVPNHVKSITTTNISNWNAAYGWGDHSLVGYLTSYTETDPNVPIHVKAITTTNIANWNTAFSWGDHSLAGYLTSYTETDPNVPSHVKSITTTNISNWNTAFAWGNHASAGYLTSYTETDPNVPIHVKAITTTNIANWNTAHGWGNHASAGYLTSYTETDPNVPSHVKSITTTNISNWNSAFGWGNHASAGYMNELLIRSSNNSVNDIISASSNVISYDVATITYNTSFNRFGLVDPSNQSSVNNSGSTYIQDIYLDAYGRVTGINSATNQDNSSSNELQNLFRNIVVDDNYSGGVLSQNTTITADNTADNVIFSNLGNYINIWGNSSGDAVYWDIDEAGLRDYIVPDYETTEQNTSRLNLSNDFIYQRTFDFGTVNGSSSESQSLGVTPDAVELIVTRLKDHGGVWRTGDSEVDLLTETGNVEVGVTGANLVIVENDSSFPIYNCQVTVYYTK